jgi:hypothetical protein
MRAISINITDNMLTHKIIIDIIDKDLGDCVSFGPEI